MAPAGDLPLPLQCPGGDTVAVTGCKWTSLWDEHGWLVVWNMFYFSHHIGNVIIPTDELIFLRGVGIPPTRWFSDVYWTIVEAHRWFDTTDVTQYRSEGNVRAVNHNGRRII